MGASGLCRLIDMRLGDVFDVDTGGLTPSSITGTENLSHYLDSLPDKPLAHEKVVIPVDFEIPWLPLLSKAANNVRGMQEKLGIYPDWYVTMKLDGDQNFREYSFDMSTPNSITTPNHRRITFKLDARLMLIILPWAAVWDNAYASSLIETARNPDMFNPDVARIMSFFKL